MSEKKIKISADFLPESEAVDELIRVTGNGTPAPVPASKAPVKFQRKSKGPRRATTEVEAMNIILGRPGRDNGQGRRPDRGARLHRIIPDPLEIPPAARQRNSAPSESFFLAGAVQFGSVMAAILVGALMLPLALAARVVFPPRPAKRAD